MAEASIGLVLDCADAEKLAAFWSSALGIERIGSAGDYVLLASPSRSLPKLVLQRVAESRPEAGVRPALT